MLLFNFRDFCHHFPNISWLTFSLSSSIYLHNVIHVRNQCLFLNPQGVYYQTGDVIKVTDEEDGKSYYAQIRGFMQDQYCEKSAALTWLIPTQSSPKDQFDPGTYIVGEQREITFFFLQTFRPLIWQVKNCLFCLRSRGGSAQKDRVPWVCVPCPLWILQVTEHPIPHHPDPTRKGLHLDPHRTHTSPHCQRVHQRQQLT